MRESGRFLDEFARYNNPNELGDWQIEEGFDTNITFHSELEDAYSDLAMQEASSDTAIRFKNCFGSEWYGPGHIRKSL